MERWTSPSWRAEVSAWVDDGLTAAGRTRTGDLEEVRIRPWGIVLAAPTSGGRVFMKATAAATAFEVRLYDLLVRVVPDHVLHPIALDVEAGWLLLPDGGLVLTEQASGDELLERLVEVVPQYAAVQVALAPHADALLAAGVADMRPTRMVERFDEAMDVARAATARAPADRAERLDRVAALRGAFAAQCERLAAAPGAPTIDHNDLHGANVFATGAPGAIQARFFDWGDAVLAHPFASVLVLRSVVRWLLDVHEETPTERRIVDAYLEPFTGQVPAAELREVVDAACEVGKVARALVWARAVAALPTGADDPDGFASAPLEWMLELLDGPLAGASR